MLEAVVLVEALILVVLLAFWPAVRVTRHPIRDYESEQFSMTGCWYEVHEWVPLWKKLWGTRS